MEEVLKFLTENIPFYVATTDGACAHVRPFGFVALHEGKLLFATRSEGNFYKELQANPAIEISTTNKSYEWIRIIARAELIIGDEKKRELMNTIPALTRLSADAEGLGVYYAEDAAAAIYSMTTAPRKVEM